MISQFYLLRSFQHLFFPHTCCGCGSDLLAEHVLFCIYCQASMPVTHFENYSENIIEKAFWGRAEIQSASAHLYFTSGSFLQKSLHLLKYKGRKEIGVYYGNLMGVALKKAGRFNQCEIIIPLPLYASREKKRGYNQAALLAEGLSKELKIPLTFDAVLRIKKTETQTHKSRIERWKNMESIFEVSNFRCVAGKHVLLVDDVITTGATLEACARVLLAVPGVRVSVACLAYTVNN